MCALNLIETLKITNHRLKDTRNTKIVCRKFHMYQQIHSFQKWTFEIIVMIMQCCFAWGYSPTS